MEPVAQARRFLEQSLEIRKQMQDRQGLALTSLELGSISRQEHRLGEARQWIEESLCLAQNLGDKFSRGRALAELGKLLVDLGQFVEAHARFHQALRLQETIHDVRGQCITLHKLADLERELGNLDEAIQRYRESAALAKCGKMPYWEGLNHLGLGRCARQRHDLALAMCAFEAVYFLARQHRLTDLQQLALRELQSTEAAAKTEIP